jgi:hypothetical protein
MCIYTHVYMQLTDMESCLDDHIENMQYNKPDHGCALLSVREKIMWERIMFTFMMLEF